MTNLEKANKHFLIYTIANFARSRHYDFDVTRDVLVKSGIYELLKKYPDRWVSHNQKWRNKTLDQALAVRGISIEKDLANAN